MRWIVSLGLMALMLPLSVAAERLLFAFDEQQTAAMSEAVQPGLVDDGQRAVAMDLSVLLKEGQLNLPDGYRYDLRQLAVEEDALGAWVWHGRLERNGRFVGTATFTVRGQRVAGLFAVGDRRFELISTGPGRQLLLEFDPAQRPEAHPPAGPVVPSVEETSATESTTKVAASAQDEQDGPVVIDVLTVYTPEVLEQANDEVSLRLSIQNAINATNTAYINSGVDQRVRLVAQAPIDFTEDTSEEGMQDDLGVLQSHSDAEALRDRHAADLVALIGRYSGSGFCGIAYLKTGFGSGWAVNGFSITRRACLGNQTLAHELGHNMGLAHDPANTEQEPDDLIVPYAFGYRIDGEFRTIMSYAEGCSNCPQIDHFSNPDVIDEDSGMATGTSEQDAARALGDTAVDISEYREPLAELGDALNASELDWETGGGGLWYVQEDVTLDGEPVPVSGAIVGEEESWIGFQSDQPVTVSFDWQTRLSDDMDVSLEVLANGEVVETFQNEDESWQQASVPIETLEPQIRWRIRAPEGAEFDSVGSAYIGNVVAVEGDVVSGIVRNVLGQPVSDVDVEYQADEQTLTRTTDGDGSFIIIFEAGGFDDEATLRFQGEGLQASEIAAEECLGGDSACEQVIEGEPRLVSGSVTGLGPDEHFDMAMVYRDADGNRQIHTTQAVSSDSLGTLTFELEADSAVLYNRVDAQVNGYRDRRYEPEDGISLRDGDLDGVEIEVSPLSPNFTGVQTLETTSNSFVASATLQTFGRDQEVTVRYGKGNLNEASETRTIPGDMDNRSEVEFEVTGLDCGSSYSWRMETVSDNGTESSSAQRSASTAACSGGGGSDSSSGCTLGSDNATPLLAFLIFLAGLTLWRRRPPGLSCER